MNISENPALKYYVPKKILGYANDILHTKWNRNERKRGLSSALFFAGCNLWESPLTWRRRDYCPKCLENCFHWIAINDSWKCEKCNEIHKGDYIIKC